MQAIVGANQDLLTTARVSYKRRDFYNLDQALLSLGISANYVGSSVKASLESEKHKTQSNLAVSLTQNYYSASVEYPGRPAAFVKDDRLSDLVRRTKFDDVSPLYVASITYGRTLLFFVTSSEEKSKLSMAVDAAVSFMTGSASAHLGVEEQNVLRSSEIKIVSIGGPSGSFIKLLRPGTNDSIEEFLRDGVDFNGRSGGVPISYVLRHVKDGSVVSVKMAVEFTIPKPPTPAPRLSEMSVTFNTKGDNKDNESVVGVEVLGDGNVIGSSEWSPSVSAEWTSNSSNVVKINPVNDAPLTAKSYAIRVRYLGKAQTWNFTMSASGKITGGASWNLPEVGTFLLGEGNPHELTLPFPNP